MYYSQKYNITGFPVGLFSIDYPTLKDRQISKIAQEFPNWLGGLSDSREQGLAFRVRPKYGGFNILLRNLDNPRKYSSSEFPVILVEELTENQEGLFEDLVKFRLRYPNLEEVKFIGASNPGGVGHRWVKKKWVSPDPADLDTEQENFFYVPAKYSDNKFNSAAYIRQLNSLPPEKRKMLMDGSWDVFVGQYFEEFSEMRHISPAFRPYPQLLKYGGIDWGYSHSFVFLGAALQKVNWQNPKTGEIITFHRLWVYKEFYGSHKTPQEWAKIINEGVKLNEYKHVVAGPDIFNKRRDIFTPDTVSKARIIADDFRLIWQENAHKLGRANNDRIQGWQQVHNWLKIAPDGQPYLKISQNCVNTIRVLPSLIHDPDNMEDVLKVDGDDPGDCLRYLIMHVPWIDAWVGFPQAMRKSTIPLFKDQEMVANMLESFEEDVKPQRGWKA